MNIKMPNCYKCNKVIDENDIAHGFYDRKLNKYLCKKCNKNA